MRKYQSLVAALCGVLFSFIASFAFAFGPAFVNPTLGFGPNGTGYVDVDLGASPHDYGEAVTTAPDGSLYMLGLLCKDAETFSCEDPYGPRNYGIAVAHLSHEGVLDVSFGTEGVQGLTGDVPFTGNQPGYPAITLDVDGNGRYLVGGPNTGPGASAAFQLARFSRNGTVDITYGPTGNGLSDYIPTPGHNTDVWVSYMLIGPDEKVYVYGVIVNQPFEAPLRQAFLARLDKNGRLDSSFNPSGKPGTPGAIGAMPGYLPFKYGRCDSNGMGTFSFSASGTHLYLAGNTSADCFSKRQMMVARISRNGTFDPSFGIGGKVRVPSSEGYFGASVQEDPASGKIAVLGAIGAPGGGLKFRLVQLNHDGSEDASVTARDFSYVPSDSHFRLDYLVSRYLFQNNGRLVWTGIYNNNAAMTRLAGDPAFSNPVRTLPVYDLVPDAFSLTDVSDAPKGTIQISNSITIRGVTALVPVSVSDNWSYSINGGPWIGGFFAPPATAAKNGDIVRVRVTSSRNSGETVSTTLNIGEVTDTFSVTTASDTVPDPFSFPAQIDVPKSTVLTAGPVTVSGIDSPSPISVTGGSYSLDGTTFTTAAGTVTHGAQVWARQTSSGNPGTTTVATVTIGTVAGSFSATTARDTTPNAFSFTPATVTDATPGTLYAGTATPTGYDSPTTVSISGGGMYRVAGGSWTSSPGTISPSQTLEVQMAAPAAGTTASMTATVGGESASFSVSSKAGGGGGVSGNGGGGGCSSIGGGGGGGGDVGFLAILLLMGKLLPQLISLLRLSTQSRLAIQ